jgi:hypothetical protein
MELSPCLSPVTAFTRGRRFGRFPGKLESICIAEAHHHQALTVQNTIGDSYVFSRASRDLRSVIESVDVFN